MLPRALNVLDYANARAAELHVLSSHLNTNGSSRSTTNKPSQKSVLALSNKNPLGSVPIPHHLRRRTRSHNRRRKVFRLKGKLKVPTLINKAKRPCTESVKEFENENSNERPPEVKSRKKPLCRRLRRRNTFKAIAEGCDFETMGKDRFLETHVWHAKRFRMSTHWGHSVADGLPGRGRQSRSILKWAEYAAVLHDGSYNSFIQLSGPQGSLEGIVALIGGPSLPLQSLAQRDPDNFFAEAHKAGACLGSFMLHEVSAFPRSAVGPVWTLWRPTSSQSNDRSLMLFVHPAAWESSVRVVKEAMQHQVMDSRSQVSVQERMGDIVSLEMIGSSALGILQKVLKEPLPVSARSNESLQALESSQSQKLVGEPKTHRPLPWHLLMNGENLPAGTVLTLQVTDPRTAIVQPSVIGSRETAGTESRPMEVTESDPEYTPQTALKDEDNLVESNQWEDPVDWWTAVESGRVSEIADCPLIWDPERGSNGRPAYPKPTKEEVLCEWRRQTRVRALKGESGFEVEPVGKCGAATCPVVVIKYGGKTRASQRWALLLPAGWCNAFWVPLIKAGGRVIGLRERRWLATAAGYPSFPFDFPDCKAYDEYQARKYSQLRKKHGSKPASKRERDPPTPPNWTALLLNSENNHQNSNDLQISVPGLFVARSEKVMAASSLLSRIQETEGPSAYVPPASEKAGFQKQKSAMSVRRAIKEGQLKWVPVSSVKQSRKELQEELVSGEPLAVKNSNVSPFGEKPMSSQPICLVRVTVRLPRKGVAEEGAMLFAPTSEDFELYCRRGEDWQGAQVSNSKEMESKSKNLTKQQQKKFDRAKTQVQDSVAHTTSVHVSPHRKSDVHEALREVVGFVTSQAPRGSILRTAVAFCKIGGLSKLRAKQYSDRGGNGDWSIFLLLRNKDSFVYRPALVSTCVESCCDYDIHF